MNKFIFNPENAVYILVDMQQRLAAAMCPDDLNAAVKGTMSMLGTCNALDIPVIPLRQYPKGLGDIMPELKTHVLTEPVDKTSFSAWGEPLFIERLKRSGCTNIFISGMETHVCVLQTAMDLLFDEYNVHVLSDCCISRSHSNKMCGLDFMRQAGAVISSSETAVMQLIKTSTHRDFKLVSALIK